MLGLLVFKRYILLINLYVKVYNFMPCGPGAPPLLALGNVSPAEGITVGAAASVSCSTGLEEFTVRGLLESKSPVLGT